MEQKTGTTRTAPAAPLGWLIAPLAVLLAHRSHQARRQ